MKCSNRPFALVSLLFAVLLSLSIGNELLASATARYGAVAVAVVVKASDTLGYTATAFVSSLTAAKSKFEGCVSTVASPNAEPEAGSRLNSLTNTPCLVNSTISLG